MNQPILLRTILLRMWRHKLKTVFMGIGITVAVLATVLLQTVAGSLRDKFHSFLERAYPSDGVVLMGGSGPMGGPAGRNSVKLTEVETVANSLGVTEWDPIVFSGARDIQHAGNTLRVGLAGYSEKAESVRRVSVQEGEFLSADDIRGRAKVALIGTTTARTLFPNESPIGSQLFIDNVPFRVKGILEPMGVDVHGGDQDNAIRIPYTTLMAMARVDYVSATTFIIPEQSRVEPVREEITRIMREQHQIGEGQKDDFSVFTSASMQAMFNRSFRTFKVFIPLIAGTAFLISAMVILTIMQVSIKSRMPEIGLRKAVGGRERDLQRQIVLEVVVVSAVASLVGLVLAQLGIMALTPFLAAKFGVKEASAPPVLLILAVSAAMATGLVGVVLPARRAAKLNPVEALK